MVVGLDDSSGDLRSRSHREGELGLTAVVNRQTLEEKGAEARAGSTTGRVEDKEALKTSTVIGELTDAVEDEVDDFLANGVVTTGIVVGSILLAGDELLRVVELAVGAGADLVKRSRLEVDEDSTRDVLAGTSLGEEGVEGVITAADGLVGGHLTVRLDAVLEAVELPAAISHLDATLTDVK